MHGMRDIQPTGHWKGRVAKVCYVLPLLSLPFSPSPPQEFYPHCLEQCVLLCCTSSSSTYTRLLQVFVSKFLFYYPYFYTTIVLCQFMMVFKALKLFKDDTIKIKISIVANPNFPATDCIHQLLIFLFSIFPEYCFRSSLCPRK